jgi:hypothetical protein
MYVILTSKPGQFRTEPGDGLRPVQAYDYLFFGRPKARFVIAELTGALAATRVRVVDATGDGTVTSIPIKFLERFDSPDDAFKELGHLIRFGSMETALVPV